MNELGVENFYIELIENYPCNDVYELRSREGYYIREIGTLNKNVAGRTRKEYKKQHHETNKEHINHRKHERITCNVCGYQSTRNNLARHQKSNKCKSYVKPDENDGLNYCEECEKNKPMDKFVMPNGEIYTKCCRSCLIYGSDDEDDSSSNHSHQCVYDAGDYEVGFSNM